jgi:aspartyl-tRNA(Asn)/glutamyl-tRNA(Gln) amidotransferase subunit A
MTRRQLIAALLAGPLPLGARPIVNQSDDFTSLSVAAASARIAAATLSPADLVDAYLTRIARVDPDIHAFITVTAGRARADAQRATTGPLRGIPIAHKDLFETAGIRTTGGARLFESHVPTRDADAVQRLSRAGAVLIGKTNTHELGGGVTTINPFFGTTHNPSNPSRIAGGSSGGSAAAVAARLCAAATGSDTGGSVRIPAALCGVVGFIPTFGRLSTSGLLGACPTFDRVGILTRTVEDASLVVGAMTGERAASGASSGATRLRLGVARSFFFDALQPDIARAMDRVVDRYRQRGVDVVDRDLPVDARTMARVFDPIVVSEIWSRYGEDWRTRPQLFSPGFAEFFKMPPPQAADVAAAHGALAEFQERVDAALVGLDAVMMPTVPVTAPPISGPIDGALILRNTWPINAARTPAISVPCGADGAGLPIGVQLTGRQGEDERVLRVAALIG